VARTEGWAAGLRLAALSLADHPAPERFAADFSGSDRTVAEYLLAEVLERQPPQVRDLLLRTSILEQVTGGLADRLTGGTDAGRILADPRADGRVRDRGRPAAHDLPLPPALRRSAGARATPHGGR
jgi:ATP/maltotriose-dependent transcriptional regulator MalT